LVGVLERIKEVNKLKMGGKRMMMPVLKKKDVDYVLQQLQELM
jgi:hypothetical protein